MIRFLLMLLLLLPPGADLAASNTDEVESFTGTTLGTPYYVTVTPKTMPRKPVPASRGHLSKAAPPNPPLPKDGRKPPGILKDSTAKSAKVYPVQGGLLAGEGNSTHHQQRNSSSLRSQWYSTKMPMTVKSHSVGESAQTRPVIRKGPTPPSKAKAVMRSTLRNPSARYQSPPHVHHKNVTLKPIMGHLNNSNVTAGLAGWPTSPKPLRSATTPLRNTFKPGQRGIPSPADKLRRFPPSLQAVTQMSRQLKEKSSNTSVLLNAILNQNSSSITNSLQHMVLSSNSTFMTGKDAVLHEVNSLNTQSQQINNENVTSVPLFDQYNDVSRSAHFRTVKLPHEPEVMQELKSKVEVKIPDGNVIHNQTHLSGQHPIFSTKPSEVVQERRDHFQSELTTNTSVTRPTQTEIPATQFERTIDKLSHSDDHSHGHMEASTEDPSQMMTRVHTEPKNEKDLGTRENHQIQQRTHSHKHRHPVVDPLNQEETNTISQHKGTLSHRTAIAEPSRHHPKHQHNHTQPHPHGHHHKHSSDHHAQRNHISQTPIHLITQKQSDFTTYPNQTNPPQLHHSIETAPSTKIHISTHNDTVFSTKPLSSEFYLETQRENQTGSLTLQGLSETFEATQPKLITQSALDSQTDVTQVSEPRTPHPTSIADSQTAIHKLNSIEQSRPPEAYTRPHTKPFTHKHSRSHAKHNSAQAAEYSTTTVSQLGATPPKLDIRTHTSPERTSQDLLIQQELTTPTREDLTTKMPSYLTSQSLDEVITSSQPKLTIQIKPETITKNVPGSSTQTQIMQTTEVQVEVSTQKPQNVSTQKPTENNPLIPITVTLPYLMTQSQTEPTEKSPPAFVTFVYFNENEPESHTTSHTNGNMPIQSTPSSTEFARDTGPVTNSTVKSLTESRNHTVSITNTEPAILKDLKNSTGFSTKPEPITEATTVLTKHTQPIIKSKTKSPSQAEPITKIKTDSPIHTVTTTNHKNESTSVSPATYETDLPKQLISTTRSLIESLTQRALTTAESTTEHIRGLSTKTESITRHENKSGTQKSVSETQSMLQTETAPTSLTELIRRTAFKSTILSNDETTSSKGLMQYTQQNLGTTGNNEQIAWTAPTLIIAASEDPNVQMFQSRSTEVFTQTEGTSLPENTNPTDPMTSSLGTGRYHGYTNTTQDSKLAPAWNVELSQTTSRPRPTQDPSHDHAKTVRNDASKPPSSTTSMTFPHIFTPQTHGELMSVQPARDRIFIVDEQQPVFKVPTINVTYRVNVPQTRLCNDPDLCRKRLSEEVMSAYKSVAEFDRTDVLNVTLAGAALEYKVLFSVRVGSPLSLAQELVLTNPSSVFEALAASEYPFLSAIHGTSPAGEETADVTDPCTDWYSCPRGFHCVPQRKVSALCLSPCHSAFCQNDGICIHRKGQEPVCQCPVGRDFWYMGPTCDYRMTHHRLAAIACAVVFCIIICAAAAVFILVRRFQTQILQQKVAQTQSSYRRFSRFDDVPTHFWCPSQTWLTTSASLNSLDNPAFSSSEEVFPLQALGSCVCGCQDGARNNTASIPPQEPARGPPRLETSCSSVNDLMIDSGKASDVSVCSWPMEPIHWTPFPILHQLSLQSPFHARRPHSYFEGMELVNTERSWTA
ncbi:uncharacterized protein [Hyperolius riggenbachi]|uniref:uncharacterized protein isoform X2 n=1 Tax=Hyperolius riggenbachi TaxID=752182 RepID=UPI0035A333BB